MLVGCKSISSNTMDIFREDNGKYYYAWEGIENGAEYGKRVLCMGICSRRPLSMEEALTSVCTNGIKYFKSQPKIEGLNELYIIDTDSDIGFLYELTEETKDARKVCLSDTVTQNRSSSREMPEISSEYFPSVYNKPEPKNLEMSPDEYEEYNRKYRINEFSTVIIKEEERQDSEVNSFGPVLSQSDEEYAVIVKPLKRGLSYNQAKEYCEQPVNNLKKYIKDWTKVELGGGKIYSYGTPLWAQDPSNNPKVAKDNKDIYTLCIAYKDNLKDAYIYKLSYASGSVEAGEPVGEAF